MEGENLQEKDDPKCVAMKENTQKVDEQTSVSTDVTAEIEQETIPASDIKPDMEESALGSKQMCSAIVNPSSTPPKMSNPDTPMSSKPPSPQSSETSSTADSGNPAGAGRARRSSILGQSGSTKKLTRLGITWQPGVKLEAMDFSKKWYPAKVAEVDLDDLTVLVHFEGWNQRYDEWLSMDSERIRPATRHSERKEKVRRLPKTPPNTNSGTPRILKKGTAGEAAKLPKGCGYRHSPDCDHKIGDCVFARWTDCRLYPAKVMNIDPSGVFEVLFYDGFSKMVVPINVKHMPAPLQKEYAPVLAQVATSASAAKAMQRKMKAVSEKELQRIGEYERSREQKLESHEKVAGQRRSSDERPGSTDKSGRKRKLIVAGLFKPKKVATEKEAPTLTTQVPDPQAMVIKEEIKQEPLEQLEVESAESATKATVPSSGLKIDVKKKVRVRMSSGEAGTPATSSGYIDPVLKAAAAREFKIDEDHNQFKCPFDGCNKGFRKETLLEYHIKYYHKDDGTPIPPAPPKKRKKTISVCSTDSDISVGDALTTTTATDDTDRQEHMQEDLLDTTEEMDLLNRDEVVNCICQINEENGLMIQCDICLCWQHALCLGITEETLPNKYVCDICQNPPAVRESAQYMWNQDWWKEGTLACFRFLPNCDSDRQSPNVKATQDLMADMIGITNILKTLKKQLHVFKDKSHPELKRWTKNWGSPSSGKHKESMSENVKSVVDNNSVKTEQLQVLNQDVTVQEMSQNKKMKTEPTNIAENKHSIEKTETQDDNSSVKGDTHEHSVDSDETDSLDEMEERDDESDISVRDATQPPSTENLPAIKQGSGTNANTEIAGSRPESACPEIKPESKTQKEITTSTIVIETNQQATVPSSSKPDEDPLKNCETNMLKHIKFTHEKIESRMDLIEEQVAALESLDGHGDPENILSDVPQLKKSLHQLLYDLTKVKKMSMYH